MQFTSWFPDGAIANLPIVLDKDFVSSTVSIPIRLDVIEIETDPSSS